MSNLAYQEEVREELLNGKIVAMSPRPAVNHNRVVVNLSTIFNVFLEGRSCTAFSDGVDVYLTENDRVIPDVMIVCSKDIVKKDGIYGAPDLIVEVLSPSTAKNDKGYKKNLYEKCGVKEYWIVEVETRSIEVYLLKNKQYVMDNIYTVFPDYLLKKMTQAEKESIVREFNPSLFPEMTIALEKVFKGLF
ncbi:MAG: Uma2 family endonuclease [Sporomusaceae bacterium]|jgi:Uma2 family endonuclease|nr:Uma2 family endonuclease [Sporomusaceae bacterium]